MHRNGPSYSPVGVPSAKRPRIEDEYGSAGRYGTGPASGDYMHGAASMSSRVLQVRNLKDQVMEADLVDALSQFGPISYVSLTGRGVALVEFEDLTAAERCVSYNMNSDILVLGQAAIFSYSPLQIIPRQGWESERPNHVVVMYVQNPKYPITTEVISAICKPICRVIRVIIMRENGQIQCLVEFADIDAARNIKQRLNGCDIYSGCCTLKIEYAKLPRLNVTRNDQDQADYVTPPSALGADPFVSAKDRPALLQEPPVFGGARTGGYDEFLAPAPFDMERPAIPGRYPPAPGFGEPPRRGRFMEDEYMTNGQGRMGAIEPYGAPPAYQGGPVGGMRPPDGTGMGMDDSVVCFFNLDPEKNNCDKLFNIVCQYGNVVRIKFLKSKPDQAMVQMGDPVAAQRVVDIMNKCILFGTRTSVSMSRQSQINETRDPAELPDKTSSYKDYTGSRHNRFTTFELAAKNRVSPPQKFLYFYHAPPHMTEDDMNEWLERNGGVKPANVKIFDKKPEGAKTSAGILEFESVEDAIDTIMTCNHMMIETEDSKYPYSIKFCFAGSAGQGERGGGGGMSQAGGFNGPASRGRGGRGSFDSRGGRGFRGGGGDGPPSRGAFRGGRGDFRGGRGDFRGGRGDFRGGRGEYRGRGGPPRGRDGPGRGAPRGY